LQQNRPARRLPSRPRLEGKEEFMELKRTYNVLFLCTSNSARSIMAEAAMNRWGQGKCGGQSNFRAFSAGSHPRGQVHPLTLQQLDSLKYDVWSFRSKAWQEFARPGAEPLDFVITVCDKAAGEVCPTWPGQPMTAHWGVEDPAAFLGPEKQTSRCFRRVYLELEHRIKIFVSLRIEALDRLSLQNKLREIGQMRTEADQRAES
jgi:protein-tyrosine-phosphatase